jgi:aminopeptidase N
MRDYAYGNTVTGDLWKAIDKGSPRPIASIAHDLTLQAGVPMVSEVSARCGHGNTTLKLAQGHFAIDADSTTARVWQLPVTVAAIGGAPSKTVVAGARPKSLEVAGCGPVILNAGQTAYFRSRYTSDGLAAVSARFAALSPYDQLGVFYDASSLAFVGEIPIAAMLDLTRNFPADADPVVVSALVVLLRGIDHIYDGLPAQAAFRDYAGKVLAPIFVRTGWGKNPGESDNIAVLRAGLLAALGDFGDPAVIAEARQRYQRFVADAASLDAGTRRTVLGIVALHADQATWDQLHGMAKTARTQLERQEFYSLLGAAEDKTLAQQALDLAMSGEPPATITPQMINAVSARHPELAFDFTVARWDKFLTLLEPNIQARYVPRLINNASDLKLIAKLDHFAELHIPPGARQDLRKIEANVRYFAKIRQDRLPEVDIWLRKQRG